jgi:thioredoxin reductase (NADPH)
MFKTQSMKCDLAIIGAGPAGLSASVYASRYGLINVVIGETAGGLPNETHEIGNWLGTPKINGFEFAQKAVAHARQLGASIIASKVDKIEKDSGDFNLWLGSGEKAEARALLLAMGTKRRRLNISGEKELVGKGVSYCATCDGFFYKGKTVAVAGGGDSAAEAALYLAGIAKQVYLIYRKEKLRAEDLWLKLIEKNPKIEVIYNTNVKEIKGMSQVEEIILDNPHKNSKSFKLDGIFIEIGLEPNIDLVGELGIGLDEEGHIKIKPDGQTSQAGIWAAGDITTGSNKFKQIITAAAEGAIAARSIQQYLNNN